MLVMSYLISWCFETGQLLIIISGLKINKSQDGDDYGSLNSADATSVHIAGA